MFKIFLPDNQSRKLSGLIISCFNFISVKKHVNNYFS